MTQGLHDEEVLGKVYDTTLVRRLWPFLRPHSGLLVLGLVLFPPLILFELLPARLFALGLDHLVGTAERSEWAWLAWLAQPPEGLPLLVWLAVLMLGVTVLGGALNLARMVAMAVMGQRAMRDLRRVLFDHVQRLPLRFFDRYPVGRLVTRLTNDIETLSEMFTSGVVQVITDLLKLAVIALVLFQLDTWLALAAMALVPLLTVAALIFRWKVRAAFRIVRVKIARINAHIQETISGMKVVQLFVREKRNLEDFSEINAEHRNAWFRSIRYDALLFSTVEFASNLTIALILWYGAGLIGAGVIELSVLFIFVDYMKRFFEPLRDLAAKFSVMQSSMASLERVFELLDTPPESSRRPAHLTAPFRGEIEFESVCFAYGEQPVLEDVSFRVAPGERIALVGPTGSGKTTLLKLLIGLYEPQSGSIRIDGVDVRDLPREELRRHIAFVLQDVYLFSGDLAYNVSLGRDDISVEDVERASRIVHADRLIQKLPEGYRQQVHERGVNFSAGERQLLSFARALAHRPEILLLDEATSNVDAETESLIQDALHKLLERKTAIVVAHRLSTIQDVDRIYVLHKGQIREQGTHEALIAQRGLYWRLYRLQYEGQAQSAA